MKVTIPFNATIGYVTMDRFLAMNVFTTVVEQGSFAAAATRLNMSTSAVSRHVADLESHLNTRLLNRTTRKLSLTEGGELYLERALQLISDMDEAEDLVASSTIRPRGTIKLTCSISFGTPHLSSAISAFQKQYPEMKFDCSLSDGFVDLVEAGLDIAIRIGDSGNPNLIARKIGETQILLCAAPDYIKKFGTPEHPKDLEKHNCLTYEYSSNKSYWEFKNPSGKENIRCKVAGSMHANNGRMLAAFAEQGIGITLVPDLLIGAELKEKKLVPLLTEYNLPAKGIFVVYTSRRHLSAKIRTFIDFLVSHFSENSDWITASV